MKGTKLELEFELVILLNNIENNKKLGKSSIELQRRLEACRKQIDTLKLAEGVKDTNDGGIENEQK